MDVRKNKKGFLWGGGNRYVGTSGGRVGWKGTHPKRDTETLRAAARSSP